MKNQFFYTRTVAPDENGKETEEIKYVDSFNINKVVRTVSSPDGVIVLLDDLHERAFETPDIDVKSNRVRGMKKVRETVQSEITLSKEDGERFMKLTNIENE